MRTIVDQRLRAVRLGLAVSWAAFALFAVWVLRPSAYDHPDPLAVPAVGAALVVLSLVPWRRVLPGPVGETILAVWAILAVTTLSAVDVERTGPPSAIGFLVVVLLVAAAARTRTVEVLTAIAATAGFTAAAATRAPATTLVLLTVGFTVAAVLVLLIAGVGKARLAEAEARIETLAARQRELARQERELTRLYEISRTIGAGSNLEEALPEMGGRLARAVDARISAVLLYRPSAESLELLSPLWVDELVVPVDPYPLALTEPGVAQRTFVSGRSLTVDGDPRDRLLADLSTARAAFVPLRVGARPIGVLIVAERDRPFDGEDLAVLESMAAPAAMVLDQLARFAEAEEDREKLSELARMKTDFVSIVSHELRTPLTSIIGALTTLQRPDLDPSHPAARDLLRSASKQAERLRALIEDLLMVSRLEADALPMRPASLAPQAFIQEVVAAIPGARGRVTVDVGPAVTRIDADPDHLRRMLVNLVENALVHGGDGPVEVVARSGEEEVVIAVVDHGPGIPYERRDRIFERFTQLEAPQTRRRSGTGLGLFIVRGLAEAMGGTVRYEPTVGGGATFAVILPARPG